MKRDRFVLAFFVVVFSFISFRPVTAAVTPTGDVYPSDPTGWTSITNAFIGLAGVGGVLVNDASTIESSYSYLGRGPDAIGTVTVSGANSTWTIWDNLYVGDQGDGTLEIQNGAIVNNWDCSYIAYAGGSTGQVTVDGDGSLWAHVNDLYVGRGGQAALSVTGGATVNNSHGIIADSSPGLLNQVTVSGSGSTWTNRSALYVGYSGDAALDVLNGGKVESATGFVAGYYDASGTMTIDGTGSTWDNAGNLTIGHEDANTGTLSLTGGGSLTNGQNLYVGYLGKGTLSVGVGSTVTNTGTGYISYKTPEYVISYPWGEDQTDEVTVSGAGAAWNNGGDLYVGYESKATLEVTAGGTVTNTVGYIGNTGNGRGEVTVSGADSTWTNSDNLYVGYYAYGKLDIAYGAAVENKQGYIGYYSSGCEATVDGDSSTWTNSSNLTVGYGGNGSLDITGGGSVSNHSGSVADGYGSTGNVTVDGHNSTWTSHGSLTVGVVGMGTLTITNQGNVISDGSATIAHMGAATGQVTVDGSGSSLTISGDKITIGNYGQGTLQITGGADVSCKSGSIAAQKNSTGSVTVRGAGSTWVVNTYGLKVGNGGSGTLLVDQQATLTSGSSSTYDDSYIGNGINATGQATIDGAGASWTHHGNLYVGHHGTGTLNITNGSDVTIDEATYVGYEAYATGAINFGTSGGTLSTRSLCVSPNQVSGTGTINAQGLVCDTSLVLDSTASLTQTLSFGGVNVNLDLATNPATNGYLGAGWRGTGSMTISDGTTVQSDNGYLGYVVGSHGTATVTGAGSTWTNGGNTSVHLYVGYRGNGTLSITDGGTVEYCDSYIGCENGSIGTATVDGTDSTWTSSHYLHVGHDGHGTLYVNNGGTVSCYYCNVENGSVFVNGKSSTTGTASSLTATGTGNITIGDGLLKITNGGAVESYRGTIGHWTTDTGRVTVDGTDSTWTMGETFYVANYGTATVTITDGGTVSNTYGKIACRAGGTGTVTVSGANSAWTNSNKLYVGEYGTATVEVNDGGTISNTDGYIAYENSATGTVLVTGTNSTWTNTGTLAIGTDGEALLVINDGGNVSATGASINSQSLLAVEVNDGSLLNVGSGTGTLTNDGTVRAIAGATPTAGTPYSPIAAGTWAGSGIYQAVGGTWNATTHALTPSAVVNGSSGTAVSIDLATQQRVLIDDGGNPSIDWTVGASFLEADTTTMLDFTATVVGGQVLADLQDYLDTGDVVLAAWDFDAPGYSEDDSVYISFDVGPGCSRDDLQIWHYDEVEELWSRHETWDMTYDGTYVSFTPGELSIYAVTPFKNNWIPGDCDGDNRVDEEDAATLADHWREEGRWADGDFNGDGMVDEIDASIMAANWGDWTTSSEQGGPSVPEPGTVVLLIGLGFFSLYCTNRRSGCA